MNDRTTEEKDPETLLEQWWKDWWAEDYSWAGLANRDWTGWSVTPDNNIVETLGAPAGSREASLQDYFRWDADRKAWRDDGKLRQLGLLHSEAGQLDFHILHLPLRWQNGEESWKADPEHELWSVIADELVKRMLAAEETRVENARYPFSAIAQERRAQLSGSIIKSPPRLRRHVSVLSATKPAAKLHIFAHKAFFLQTIDFQHTHFGPNADFTDAIFADTSAPNPPMATFDRAVFTGVANFHKATFITNADFRHTAFVSDAIFSKATFSRRAFFLNASFTDDTEFSETTFTDDAYFSGATFTGSVNFRNAVFGRPSESANTSKPSVIRGANFDSAHFEKSLIAKGATFHHPVSFHGSVFDGYAKFGDASQGCGARFLSDFSFRSAQFRHLADFSRTEYPEHAEHRNSAFEGARFFEVLDMKSIERLPFSAFHGAQLDHGVLIDPNHPERAQFEATIVDAHEAAARDVVQCQLEEYKPEKDSDRPLRGINGRFAALEGGCRVLKRAMAADSDRLREQAFYGMELQARDRRKKRPIWRPSFAMIYGVSSSYGSSVGRPLGWLVVMALIFATLFSVIATVWSGDAGAPMSFGWGQPIHPVIKDSLELAGQNIFGPMKLMAFNGTEPFHDLPGHVSVFGFHTVLGLLSAVQSVLSLILFFLVALALRRKFQIN
jgi:uncharacterized protein YjbI with pentapeptide repeats